MIPSVIHGRVRIVTILFAWACWIAAYLTSNVWLVPLGLVPYLAWNSIPRRDGP